jgi:hypothetical protein
MSTDSWQERVGRSLVVLQVIVTAMVVGCMLFLAITLFLQPEPKPLGGNQTPILTYVGLGLAGVVLVVRTIVPGRVVAAGRQAIARDLGPVLARSSPNLLADPDRGGELADRLAALFTTRTIVACAPIEGAAFFQLVAYLAEGQLLALGVAITLILVLGGHFPTRSAIVSWIEAQARRIDEEGQLTR